MDSNTKEKISERIRKLFALGESTNQHEAELAMQKANELMQEYQISMSDIDLAEDGSIIQEDVFLEEGMRSATSLGILAQACATLYDGRALRVKGGNGVRLRFFGTPTDIEAMKATFEHLRKSWQSICLFDLRDAKKQAFTSRNFKASHLYGYATSIAKRAREMAAQRNANVKGATGRDLVIVKGHAINDYFKEENIRVRYSRPNMRVCEQGFSAGKNRGNTASLHGGINSSEGALRISSR